MPDKIIVSAKILKASVGIIRNIVLKNKQQQRDDYYL